MGAGAAIARARLRELAAEDLSASDALEAKHLARTPAERWLDSGLHELVGEADGPPQLARAALPTAADGTLAALAALAPPHAYQGLEGALLLTERARLLGLSRRGRIAPSGGCRLVRARDGWLAVNLPRPEDAAAIPAWLEIEPEAVGWERIEAELGRRSVAEVVERARPLGLAVAKAARARAGATNLRVITRGPSASARSATEAPRVVDLSSLWAGPLAGRLLRLAGARVLKLESSRRPDGARAGSREFFELLNGGKEGAALDFTASEGLRELRSHIEAADLVIEASRPRALMQLGIDAAAWVAARPGRIWLSITAYGRSGASRLRVGFGDDVGAAAGLCWLPPSGAPLFVGDAIADPLAGIEAALAAWVFWRRGESALLDVSLRAATARALAHAAAC